MSADPSSEPPHTRHSGTRAALRRRLVESRLALSPQRHAELSAALRAQLQRHFPELAAQHVGFCWPVKNEPDLTPLIEQWSAAGDPGFAALLPVVIDSGRALAFRGWRPGEALAPDRYGIPTPVAGPFVVPQALLLPVNGFDAAGYRLGYGGGYFDRTLAELDPAPFCVGVGFELARVASIDPQPHDRRLDAIVTEAGAFHCR